MDILLSNLNAPLFTGIKNEDMGAMLHCIGYHISSFSRGEIIALEGEHLKHIGIVLSGRVDMVKEENVLQCLCVVEVPRADALQCQ